MLLGVAVSTAIFTLPAKAFVFTDVATLIEETVGNAQEAINWVEESEMMKLGMEMDSWMSQTEMEMDAFLESTTMQTEMQHTENMHNLMINEMSEPDDQAGANCAIQSASSDIQCYATDAVAHSIDEDAYENANFTSTPSEHQQEAFEKTKTIVEHCRALQYADAPDGKDELSTSLCMRGGILNGVETQDTYTADEQEAVATVVDLISGPVPEYKESESLPEGSPEKLAAQTHEMRKLAIRSLANSSLEHVAGLRKTPGESSTQMIPSQMEVIQQFDDERWGDPEWMLKVAGASEDIEDIDNRTEILRKMAVMQSFEIHMDIIKYKQQLRMEALEAADLALKVQPL